MAKEPADVIKEGRLFHKRGPATVKDQCPAAVFVSVASKRYDPDSASYPNNNRPIERLLRY